VMKRTADGVSNQPVAADDAGLEGVRHREQRQGSGPDDRDVGPA
jgi:hypothetical protein